MPIPSKQVKPFRTGQKTDANDAITVASRAANIKPARVLSLEQQSLQSIEKIRSLINKQKLQLSNQVRCLLLEFGLVINKSVKNPSRKMRLDYELLSSPETRILKWLEYKQLKFDLTILLLQNRFAHLKTQLIAIYFCGDANQILI
ncbi:transposase [Pseudoalteromonas sp. NBT06-2]|uniref:transposase n=1 Tax=Pseudoalteromonas sp. NBT06-2 TaxID=2025950 RepID=UPI0011409670|nr:transposase [Pseudoalteromonas sp. NBT06-2]